MRLLPQGPWGTLRAFGIIIEPPVSMVDHHCETAPSEWHFSGLPHDGLAQVFTDAELQEPDRAALLSAARCDATGCGLTPSIEQVARLSGRARDVIYRRLVSVPDDANLLPVFRRRVSDEDAWSGPEMPAAARALIAERSFRVGKSMMFVDMPLLCRALDETEEGRTARTPVLRSLSRVPSKILQLYVSHDTNIDALVDYWGEGGRRGELRTMLESLARVPGGTWFDVTHLLPPMARARLYHFPDEAPPLRDCHWTSFNFFRDPPDDSLMQTERVNQVLSTEYEQVDGSSPRFGDVVLFVRTDGGTATYLHSAVFVADDVLFTKNGRSPRRPWSLMRLAEVRATYYLATELRWLRRRQPVAPWIAK